MLQRGFSIRRERGQQQHQNPQEQEDRRRRPRELRAADAYVAAKPGPLRGQVEAWSHLVARYRHRSRALFLLPPDPASLRNSSSGIYRPLDRARDEIRILTILPSTHADATVCCAIEVLALAAAARQGYDALSYCWGSGGGGSSSSSGERLAVLVNDTVHSVTASLAAALRELRDAEKPVRLWVDALCINQADTRERNHQVGLMLRIYGNASTVRVSLNPAGARVCAAVRVMLEMLRARTPRRNANPFVSNEAGGVGWTSPWNGAMLEGFDTIKPVGQQRTAAEEDGLPEKKKFLGLSEEDVLCLVEFFAHPWWSRIWVVQEVHLAEHCVVHAGGLSIGFHDVLPVAERLWNILDSLLSAGQTSSLPVAQLCADTSSAKALLHILTICNMEKNERSSLIRILAEARLLRATEPRDQVYGLIGLSPFLQRIEPDYSLALEHTYIKTCSRILKATGTLDILFQAGLQINKSLAMPTWVPDWTRHEGGQGLQHIKLRNLYKAAGNSLPSFTARKEGGLLIKSTLVDVISQVATWAFLPDEPTSMPDVISSIIDLSTKLSQRPQSASANTRQSLAEDIMASMRTIAMDVVKTGGPHQRGFESAIRYYSLNGHVESMIDGSCAAADAEDDSPQESRSLRRFLLDELTPNFAEQSLCNTKAGRLALVPQLSQPGDSIQIIAGFQMPVVMRQCGRGRFQFIGVCYLDQLMDNSAVGSGIQIEDSAQRKVYSFKSATIV